jgi:hypothetical protein
VFELQVRSRSGTFGVQPHTSSAPVVTPSPLRPRATESTFWVASCMPSTSNGARFIGISVNKMETCVVGGVADDEWPLWAFLNVSASCLIEDHGSISAFARPRRGWLEVEDVVYESAGGDAVNLMVVGADDFMRLLTDDDGPSVVRAARDLNLMLMRKGHSLHRRSHNFALADLLLEPSGVIRPEPIG